MWQPGPGLTFPPCVASWAASSYSQPFLHRPRAVAAPGEKVHLCGSRAWGAAIQEPCVPTRARSVMPQQCSACTACGTPKAPFLPSRPRVTTCCGPPLRHGHLLGVARGKITEVEHSGNCHKGWVPSETPEERGRPSSPMCEPRGGAGEEGGRCCQDAGEAGLLPQEDECEPETECAAARQCRVVGRCREVWGG